MEPQSTLTVKAPWWRPWVRPAMLLIGLAGLWWLAERTGVRHHLTEARLQQLATEAGALGLAAFLMCFVAGQLLHVPGVVFIVAARVAYGPAAGLAVAYAGAVAAVTLSFLFVRAVGGRPLAAVKWAPLRKILTRIEQQPVWTIALVRLVAMVSPPATYAFALSPVRNRDHVFGSALGLSVSVSAVVLLSDGLLALVRGWL